MYDGIRSDVTAGGGQSNLGALCNSRRTRLLVALAMLFTLLVSLAPVASQAQQDPPPVTGLTISQSQGFTTLKWNPVPGASEYEIHRTPVDAENQPTGASVLAGIWRPNRQVTQDVPTFADAGYNTGDRFGWQVRARVGAAALPSQVVIDTPPAAAGNYGAAQATFGPPASAGGISGNIVLVNASTGVATEGCGPLVGFPAGAIALIDRGTCNYTVKTANAQAAGAIGVVLANNTGGTPPNPTGTDATLTIPTVQVSQADGAILKAATPLTGTVRATPVAPLSDPVYGTTLPQWGDPATAGENLRTQWEQTLAAQFTNDVNEYDYTAALDAASDRVRVVEIGRTLQNRPVNMFIIGYPAPPATAEEIAAGSAALVNCNVHGNEPSSREACMIMARELAFGTDARTLDILSKTTVLLVPSINGDGRASNSRGNATGQDLNRDYSLIRQPETFGFVEMLRDYRPQAAFDGHEFGNSNAGDLPVLPPRHLNAAQEIFDESMNMIEGWMYSNGSEDGWWYCPYGCQGGGSVGLSEETILRNTSGLKNTVASLLEARSSGGATRPNEGNAANNRRRKTYSALYTYHQFLDYFIANQDAIHDAVDASVAFQESNTGRIVFRGSRPIPAHPAPHPGEAPPPNQNPTAAQILESPPCAYLVSDAQYNGPRSDSPAGFPTTAGERIAAHGWAVEDRPAGYVVRMAQRERGLIPLLLDAQAAEEMVDGTRLYECPFAAVDGGIDAGVVEDTQEAVPLTISNLAPEADQPLNWTITEAAASCDTPSDIAWLSAAATSGSTASGSSTAVDIVFDATGLTAPDVHTAVLCLNSNDAGEPVITVPVSLQVEYPVSGLPTELDFLAAGQRNPVRFSLDGDRGTGVFAAPPTSAPLDCDTLEVTGPAVGTTGGPLQYDAAGDVYRFPWLVPAAWAGTCRTLNISFDDGTTHTIYYRVRR